MATVSQLPASLNLVCTVGNDFTLTMTVTENGSTWSSSGVTFASDIIARDGTVQATDFTVSATDGSVTLTLSDANTTTLGVGVYRYRLSATEAGVTRDWVAGTLSVVEAGEGGSSSSAASLSITNGTVTLQTTTLVAPDPTILPAASGTDDTTAIQAILTTYAGRVIKGRPGQSYIISDPLVISSGTTLDMTGCTITLQAGSDCNMVQNLAVATANRTVTDGAITSGATTFTSNTAAFTSADVGRSIVIQGAGQSGTFPLCTTISAYTNPTTVTVATAALATVSGASTSIYVRDTNITITGGTWARGNNNGAALSDDQHSLFFRRVDGLRVNIDSFTSSNGKYALHPGDVTNFDLSIRSISASSDGIHVRGPASGGIIRNTYGTTGDDLVIYGASDTTRPSCAGDISDVTVRDINPLGLTTGFASVKLYGSTGYSVKRVNIDNVRGRTGGGGIVVGASDITGATLDDISVANVETDDVIAVDIKSGTNGTIRVNNVSTRSTSTSAHCVRVINSGTSVAHLSVSNAVNLGGNGGIVNVHTSSTVTTLNLDTARGTIGASPAAVVLVNGTVTNCQISNVKATIGASSAVLYTNPAITSPVITRAVLSNIDISGGGAIVKTSVSTHTLGDVWMSNCYCTGTSFVIDLATATTVRMFGIFGTSLANNFANLRATSNAVLLGAGFTITGSNTGISTSAGYALRINAPDLPASMALVTSASTGDRFQNTAAASGVLPGAGPVIYDGTTWRLAHIGAVKTGTATLVGGTVTVNDSAITTNSVIRLAHKTIGGTPGAVYVSARTASTSFAITSTSGTDTSVIQYDIITY